MKTILKLIPIIILFLLGCKEEIEPFSDVYGFYEGESEAYSSSLSLGKETCLGSSMEIRSVGNNQVTLFAYCFNSVNKSKFENLLIGNTTKDSILALLGTAGYYKIKYGIFDKKTNTQIGFIGKQRLYLPIFNPKSYIDEMYFYIPKIISNTGDTLTQYWGKRQFKEVQL